MFKFNSVGCICATSVLSMYCSIYINIYARFGCIVVGDKRQWGNVIVCVYFLSNWKCAVYIWYTQCAVQCYFMKFKRTTTNKRFAWSQRIQCICIQFGSVSERRFHVYINIIDAWCASMCVQHKTMEYV